MFLNYIFNSSTSLVNIIMIVMFIYSFISIR